MVFPVFYEASGTSARDYPHEPTASKPCRPRVVPTSRILSARRAVSKQKDADRAGAGGPALVAGLVRRRLGPGAARPCTPRSGALLATRCRVCRRPYREAGPKGKDRTFRLCGILRKRCDTVGVATDPFAVERPSPWRRLGSAIAA